MGLQMLVKLPISYNIKTAKPFVIIRIIVVFYTDDGPLNSCKFHSSKPICTNKLATERRRISHQTTNLFVSVNHLYVVLIVVKMEIKKVLLDIVMGSAVL